MLRYLFLTIYLVANSAIRVAAEPFSFVYTPGCQAAYQAYLALKVDEGDALVKKEILAQPYNLMPVFLADYSDCITLLFNGDPHQFSQRKGHEQERLDRLNEASDFDPWKRLAKAAVHLHWALVNIRQGEQLKAATGFRRSYILLKENAARFPAFAPDDVLYGAEEALTGIIPESYRWFANILGMKGSLPNGIARLSNYLRNHPVAEAPLREEALLYEAFIRFHFGGAKPAVWQFIGDDATFPVVGNPMRSFFRANLALSFRKADAAIHALQQALALPASRPWPILEFEYGSALLLKLDPSSLSYFDRYISRNKGKLYTKDALQMAALAAYLAGDKAKAENYRRRILAEGNTLTDADKQAQRFAKDTKWPNHQLLTARLLIDGGYSSQALTRLKAINPAVFTEIADKLEYDFRLGRAQEETGNMLLAVQTYQRVINAGRNRPEHFAARSAIQMAGIYESRAQKAEAIRYYQLALSMRDHDYQSSIDQQAKAGLARLGVQS